MKLFLIKKINHNYEIKASKKSYIVNEDRKKKKNNFHKIPKIKKRQVSGLYIKYIKVELYIFSITKKYYNTC